MGQQVNVYESLNLIDNKGFSEKIVTASPNQWFTEASSNKQYEIGTKLVVEDMVFRYAHTNLYCDSNWRGRGLANLGLQPAGTNGNGHITIAAATAASAAATSLSVTLDHSYAATADEFKNGFIALQSEPWSGWLTGRISGNDATSTTTAIRLKEGIVAAFDSTPGGKLFWNQYAYVGKAFTDSYAARRTSQVGCLWTNVAANTEKYVWLQTWGPYVCQYGETEYPGLGKSNRAVYFDNYGGIYTATTMSIYGEGQTAQLAGFSLGGSYDQDATGGEGWNPWIMLQISP